jgi:hypothetical protein
LDAKAGQIADKRSCRAWPLPKLPGIGAAGARGRLLQRQETVSFKVSMTFDIKPARLHSSHLM